MVGGMTNEEAKVNQQTEGTSDGFIIDEATDEVLRLHLDKFQGPLEVLLYLIKAQEIDIFDIPIVKITEQYLKFLELMREENLDVTAEFLVMAATLLDIKSRMLLPEEPLSEEEEDIEEEDPRLELVEKLLEYRKYRDIAFLLETLEKAREDWFARTATVELPPEEQDQQELLEVTLYDLLEAFRGVLRFFSDDLFHTVTAETASVDEKIEYIQERLARETSIACTELFQSCQNRIEVVCCFLAILELCRMGKIKVHQSKTFGEIRLFAAAEGVPA